MRWWVELAVGALALVGLWVTVDKAARGVGRVWAWLVRDRVAPLLEGDWERCSDPPEESCSDAGCPVHGEDYDPLEELPPEQSAADLGFPGPPQESPEVRHWRELETSRKQRWTDVEAAIWAAYDALDLEGTGFTRAMAARVRELTP